VTPLHNLYLPDLLPQRPPFILIDRLTYYDPLKATTVYTVAEGSFFCPEGRMEEAGLIENIAQTCAAHTGYKTKTETPHGGGGGVRIGLIGMIKKMQLFRRPFAGERLETTIVITGEAFSMLLVEAKVDVDRHTIASCEMKLFLTDTNPQPPLLWK
jgi:predicted hotdog family 3-hydroxylacyl-ACP dehydratase